MHVYICSIFIEANIHVFSVVRPGTKDQVTHLGVEWPHAQVQVTEHLEL
jgi:hypothetical protein